MKRSVTFTIVAASTCGLLAGAARVATSSGQSGALVRLQSSFPGVVQPGNINVSGLIRGDQVNLLGPNVNIVALSTGGNSIIGKSDGVNTPAIVGVATVSTNSGVWGQNDATGAGGLLGDGANGLRAWSAAGGFAGFFIGKTH
nr:hypothetical protein [Fimbriimonadaceae bacterium]